MNHWHILHQSTVLPHQLHQPGPSSLSIYPVFHLIQSLHSTELVFLFRFSSSESIIHPPSHVYIANYQHQQNLLHVSLRNQLPHSTKKGPLHAPNSVKVQQKTVHPENSGQDAQRASTDSSLRVPKRTPPMQIRLVAHTEKTRRGKRTKALFRTRKRRYGPGLPRVAWKYWLIFESLSK